MRLWVSQNGTQIDDVSCSGEAVYIGSRETCAVHLPDERLAGQHAVIFAESRDTWVIQPLDMSVPVQLNGMPIQDKVQLRDGDEISIDSYLIRTSREVGDAGRGRTSGTSVAQLNRFMQSQLPTGAIIRKTDEPLIIRPDQLERVGRVNVALSNCEQPERLMDVALHTLLEIFGAHRAWIGVRRVNYGPMEYVEGRLLTGQTAELPPAGENLKPRLLDRGQFILVPYLSSDEPISVLAGPLCGPDGILGMAYLDTGDLQRRFSPEDLDYFVVTLNMLGAQLDAIFRHLAKQRAETVQGEVAVAHAIQARITPRKLPQWEELQFGAFREPGREKTSDVYDVVKMANKMAAIMVAHTSAGGPMPSMLMAQAQAAFRPALMHNDSPPLFLKTLNILLYDGQQDRPLDCFAGTIDPVRGMLHYAIAGQMGAYVIGGRGEERRLGPPKPEPVLGFEKAAHYSPLEEQIEPHETLVLFTPGVTTARNSAGEAFGEDRFVNILCDGFGQLASAMLKEMLSDLRNFTQAGSQPEDITVLLAHRV